MSKKLIIRLGVLMTIIITLALTNGLIPNNQTSVKKVIHGVVDAQSIYHEPDGRFLFKVREKEGQEVKVVYMGPAPKGFVGGATVAMEGEFSIEDVFMAKRVWIYSVPKK